MGSVRGTGERCCVVCCRLFTVGVWRNDRFQVGQHAMGSVVEQRGGRPRGVGVPRVGPSANTANSAQALRRSGHPWGRGVPSATGRDMAGSPEMRPAQVGSDSCGQAKSGTFSCHCRNCSDLTAARGSVLVSAESRDGFVIVKLSPDGSTPPLRHQNCERPQLHEGLPSVRQGFDEGEVTAKSQNPTTIESIPSLARQLSLVSSPLLSSVNHARSVPSPRFQARKCLSSLVHTRSRHLRVKRPRDQSSTRRGRYSLWPPPLPPPPPPSLSPLLAVPRGPG